MEQYHSSVFDDVDTLIAELETEFGPERMLPAAPKDTWDVSSACGTALGGSF
jgi:hypothetical protein